MLKERFAEHQGYVKNKILSKATGQHFNLSGHSLNDMHITALEQVYPNDHTYIETSERKFILG